MYFFAQAAVALSSTLQVSPLEIPELVMEPHRSVTGAVEAQVRSTSVTDIVLSRALPVVLADRPLEIEFAYSGPRPGASATASIATCLSANALLAVIYETQDRARVPDIVQVSARVADGEWITRALVCPASAAGADSFTVVSVTLAGRPLPNDCLPITMRVRYNHSPTPFGLVAAAANSGNVSLLTEALEAGASTEEADEVRATETVVEKQLECNGGLCDAALRFSCSKAALVPTGLPTTATSTPSVSYLQLVPTQLHAPSLLGEAGRGRFRGHCIAAAAALRRYH